MTPQAIKKCIEGTREERIFLCEKSFGLFFSYYFIEQIKYKYAPFHLEMFDKLMRLDRREKPEMLTVAFRESSKTSIARAFILWQVLYRKANYILIASYSQENAESNLASVIMTLQNNKRLQADFGNINPKKNTDEKGYNRIQKFMTTTDILLEAMTTQQSPRGRLHPKTGKRPDLALLDDIETSKTVESVVMTNNTKRFTRELLTAMDSTTGRVLYACNHISDIGVVQELIDNSHNMLYMNVPIMTGDKLSWPQKYTLTDEPDKVSIESLKKLARDSITFDNEYMNLPMSEERRVFKKSLFQYVDKKPDGRLNCFIAIDPAFTVNSTSDYTGIAIVWVDTQGYWYVKTMRVKQDGKQLVDMIFNLYDEYKPEKIGVEEVGFTQALKPFIEDEMRRRGKHFVVTMLKHGGTKKEVRIRGLLPFFEAGTIKLLEGENDALVDELMRYPNAVEDDVSDATSYLTQMFYKPYDTQNDDYEQEEPLYPSIGL